MKSKKRKVEFVLLKIEDSVKKRWSLSEHGFVYRIRKLDVMNESESIDNFDASHEVIHHLLLGLFFHLHEEVHLL